MVAEVYSHPLTGSVVVVIISGKRISVGSSEDPALSFMRLMLLVGRVRGRALVITLPPPPPSPLRQLESTFNPEAEYHFLGVTRRGHGQDGRGQEFRRSTPTECLLHLRIRCKCHFSPVSSSPSHGRLSRSSSCECYLLLVESGRTPGIMASRFPTLL